ncbi:hypothetical protein N7532_001786 [Penicillium argentinense]|uniref:AAA+ ATPase lid domain-containing protein n=1 Tax=Penicillium argentinense TaxID=1131581 RepID=A0A9W9G368_9EURO|nr:uncharacterized protein N7532_001786 [Penicillium argentinense]KAJ5111251.1 hypothetical protein N7532_001786 [Penicillium argentinense]
MSAVRNIAEPLEHQKQLRQPDISLKERNTINDTKDTGVHWKLFNKFAKSIAKLAASTNIGAAPAEPGTPRKRNISNSTGTAAILGSVEALRAMRVYVEFVDSELMPLYRQYEVTNSQGTTHIVRFDDLWCLFRPGELLFNPNAPDPTNGKSRERSFRSRNIQSLDIYPIRFAHDHLRILQEVYDQGKMFQDFVTEKHLSYKGWTIGDYDHLEYIDSDVIVDFVEALKAHPRWAAAPHIPALHDTEESFPLVSDEVPGTIYPGAFVDTIERKSNLQNDKFLKNQSERRRKLGEIPIRKLEEQDFVAVDIHKLKFVADRGEQLKNIFIAKEHKKMINASRHYPEQGERACDPIAWCPGGWEKLYCGGIRTCEKKATVYYHLWGPWILSVGFGNLSQGNFMTGSLVGLCLVDGRSDVFLSQRSTWDLKRNALVSGGLFKSTDDKHRPKDNQKRVSTHPRVLQWSSFLTTNRVGRFDETFKSRIHVILYYPPLSRKQTEGIWRINIRKLTQIENERQKALHSGGRSDGVVLLPLKVDEEEVLDFAFSHWPKHQHGKGRCNDGHIRNAFQIAAALARFEMRTAAKKREKEAVPDAVVESLQGELKARHFKTVAETSHHFELYMHETMGKTDAELALEQGSRADHVKRMMTEEPVIKEYRGVDDYEALSGPESSSQQTLQLSRPSNVPRWGSRNFSDSRSTSMQPTQRSSGSSGFQNARPIIARPDSLDIFSSFLHPDKLVNFQSSEKTAEITSGHRYPAALRAGWPSSPDPSIRPRRKTLPPIGGAWSGVKSDYK